MEGKVSSVALVVADQAKSLAFYTEMVGFEKKTDVTSPGGHRYVTVGPKGQDLEFVLWEVGSASDPAQSELSKQWAPGRVPPTFVLVTDCRQIYKELSLRGVEFVSPPTENPWGTVATFKDPDGNLFTLSQPKGHWTKQ